jgi:hypothetical protein
MTAADSTERGTNCSAGINTNRLINTHPMVNKVAQPDRAPAYSMSAERENDVLVAKLPHRPEASLAKPWPISSRLSFQRLPSRWHSMRALDAVSKKLTKAITMAGTQSWLSLCRPGHSGQYKAGSSLGSKPTTLPCWL